MAIERTFQDIPAEHSDKADQHAYLATLSRSRDVGWHDVLLSKRILIISEAGAGKTYECREQQKNLWNAGEPAFFLELSELAVSRLHDMLVSEEEMRLNAWIASQSDIATFFLDSIDELNISQGSFKRALTNLRKGIAEQLDRARIVITTRPISFDRELVQEILGVPQQPEIETGADSFAQIALQGYTNRQKEEQNDQRPPDIRTVALMPLSDQQIKAFARDQKIENPQELLDALEQNNAQEFARRPQDLMELCADLRASNRLRNHKEQVLSNIETKLRLASGFNRREREVLSMEKALEGASRLALAMTVTRRFTIRTSVNAETSGDDISLDPAFLTDWSPEEQKALLERSLFGFANYGKVRFHHRSVTEYLAAHRLKELREKGMSVHSLKQLLFAETKGKIIVRPSKRPVAAWLALEDDFIFEMLRDHEPAVLLSEGDPASLTILQRREALRSFVQRYGNGGWRGLDIPHIQLHRFASPELATEINRLWANGIENHEVRQLLLDLIGLGNVTDSADIAFTAARNESSSHGERLAALQALAKLGDRRLDFLVSELVENAGTLPDTIARGILLLLFPKYLRAADVCRILASIKVRSIDHLRWQLPDLITKADLHDDQTRELRDRLSDLVSIGLRWQDSSPHIVSDYSCFSGALAAVCVRGLKTGVTVDWLRSSVVALRLSNTESRDDEVFKQLRKCLEALPTELREQLFWIEDTLITSIRPTGDSWERFRNIWYEGSFQLDWTLDMEWIKNGLSDTEGSLRGRSLLLEAAMVLVRGQDNQQETVGAVKSYVADSPELLSQAEDRHSKAISQDKELEYWGNKEAERKQKEQEEKKQAYESWVEFWHEVDKHPDVAFSAGQGENTAWNLWRVMAQTGEASHTADWNRRFIEKQFGKDTADRLRHTLMKRWRKDVPTLPFERPVASRRTTLVSWRLGLAALYAEAEDQQWATKLSEADARIAARYALVALNGFPLWMDALVNEHPAAIKATLGKELEFELHAQPDQQWEPLMLQYLGDASEIVARLFLPHLSEWLTTAHMVCDQDGENGSEIRRLQMVLELLVKHGTKEMQSELCHMSQQRLNETLPFVIAVVWLPILMRLDARAGVALLEKKLEEIDPGRDSEAVTWFSTLFGDRHDGINLSDPQFTPELLLRLLRQSYTQVRPADDVKHDGVYSPDVRDHAERARNALMMAVLDAKGEEAWVAKQQIATDPIFVHMKDRIFAISEERWADEIDSDKYDEAQARMLDKMGEAPPSTNEAMFSVLKSRLEDIDELLLSDDSPREVWAGITEEKLMRREIARVLKSRSHAIYTISQEAVTGDEKETDIRLCSTISDHEAVIELKLGEKYSASQLCKTIQDQLVAKYMAPEHRRSGCLLITIGDEKRTWKHPEHGACLDFDDLITLLRSEAQRIERMGGIRIHVHALDLRPRLPVEDRRNTMGR